MPSASEIKAGHVVRIGGDVCKIVSAVVHSGGGRAGTMIRAKLRNLATGHISEKRWSPDEKVDEIPVDRVKMQFLYREGDVFQFMNPETFDQVPMSAGAIGPAAAFLKENDLIEVEFSEEKPLSVLYPPIVERTVSSTPEGLRGQGDTTFKEAVLENGMKVLVPQFIKEGDAVRVEVETGKYVDRVSDREVKGAKFSVSAPPVRQDKPEPKKPAGGAEQ